MRCFLALPTDRQETLPLVQCFGRILASDVVSPLDVPGFDNSAMDGLRGAFSRYCLRQPLCPLPVNPLPRPYHGEWPAGTCIRIMTGAPVPELRSGGDAGSRLNKRTMACVLLLKRVAGKIFAVAVKISLQVRLFSRRGLA